MSEFVPLFIDIEGRDIAIFGGGGVGERKARLFCGGKVRVISSRFTQGLEDMGKKGAVKLVRKKLKPEDLNEIVKGAFLVVAATGDEKLDESIRMAAESSGALVNMATGRPNVIVPSIINKGDISIGISTGGKSPAMSKYTRKKIEALLTEEYTDMVKLQEIMRERLKGSVSSQKERERILWDIIEDDKVWAALKISLDSAVDEAMRHVSPSLA
jgi:precorrin-2 dehydrogenase/sirohydrochlorin ferrochelatase